MRHLMQRLFDTSRYTSLVEKDQAHTVYGISVLVMAASTLFRPAA